MSKFLKTPLTGRRAFLKGSLAAGAVLASPPVLSFQPTTLVLSSWAPKSGLVAQNMADPWVQALEDATEGRVKIEFAPKPFGPPHAHHKLLATNQIDLGYSLHAYSGDLYQRAKIGQFSGLGDAYSASQAFSKVYSKLLNADQEHSSFHLMGLYQHGPGVLMMRERPLREPDDFKGLRIRSAGGYMGTLLNDLGAQNVQISPFEVAKALRDGAIDGAAFAYDGGFSWKMFDSVKYISELPGGYYNSTWFAGMSPAATKKVSAEDLKNLTKASRDILPLLAAKTFDYVDYLAKEEFLNRDVQVERTPDELRDHVMQTASIYETAWSRSVEKQGFDGKKALAFTRRLSGGA